jgi:hypothetical protein
VDRGRSDGCPRAGVLEISTDVPKPIEPARVQIS